MVAQRGALGLGRSRATRWCRERGTVAGQALGTAFALEVAKECTSRKTIRAVLLRSADFLLPVGEDAAALERAETGLQPVLAQLGLVARGVHLETFPMSSDRRAMGLSFLETRFL